MPIENFDLPRPTFMSNYTFYYIHQLPYLNLRDYEAVWIPENKAKRPKWRDLVVEFFERPRNKDKRKHPDLNLHDRTEDVHSLRYFYERTQPLPGTGLNDVDFPMMVTIGSDEFDELVKQVEEIMKYNEERREKRLPKYDMIYNLDYTKQLHRWVAKPENRSMGLYWFHMPRDPFTPSFNLELFAMAKDYHNSLPTYVRFNKWLQEYVRFIFIHAVALLIGLWFIWLMTIEEHYKLKPVLPKLEKLHEDAQDTFQQLHTSYWGWVKVTKERPYIKRATYWDFLVRRVWHDREKEPQNLIERLHRLHADLAGKYFKDENFKLDSHDTRRLRYYWNNLGWMWDQYLTP